MNLKLPFSRGKVDLPLDLPPSLPELSGKSPISMNLNLLLSGGVDLPLDPSPGLSKF